MKRGDGQSMDREDTYLRKFRDISDETKDAIVNTREKLNNINKRIEESGNKELIQLRRKIAGIEELEIKNQPKREDSRKTSPSSPHNNKNESNDANDKELSNEYIRELTSSISHWMNHSKSKNIVEGEYKDYAQWLFDKLKDGRDNSNKSEFIQIQQFVRNCLQIDKKNASIYNIIFNLKIFGELFKIANDSMHLIKSSQKRNKLRKNMLNIFGSKESIQSIFKLLCESCDSSYPHCDEVLNVALYFFNNLMEMQPQNFYHEIMILFETRDYSHQLLAQFYEYITTHIAYLNSGVHDTSLCFSFE